jgi:tRNA U38,U39,U40 pseudouridine synthase TruA
MTVKGMAFLWHQVRCMVAILFLIGENLEEPEVRYHLNTLNAGQVHLNTLNAGQVYLKLHFLV